MHTHPKPPAAQLENKGEKKKSPLHTCTRTYNTHAYMHITSIVPALAHSRAHLGRKKGGKSKSRMWLEGPLYETRLICILRGLEVNMHEGIKWYACERTTRSLWITVPTSEPFIFLLACNQADLVCTDWWFRTKDWTLRDVNLLRRKTLSQEGKLEKSRG